MGWLPFEFAGTLFYAGLFGIELMSIKEDLPQWKHRLAACWRMVGMGYYQLNRLTHHALGLFLSLLVVAYFIFCTLFLALRYVVLPNIDYYKGNIEQISSKVIGRPVTIARIYASWDGLHPYLSLNDVVIRDKEGRQALTLPSISATLSWWSLLVADLRLDTLQINRPDLDIRREADGKLYVGGIFIDQTKEGDTRVSDWLLSQRLIVINAGSVRWNDQRRGAPELALTDLSFVLRNRHRSHQFSLQATPPAALAAPLDVRADFAHPRFSRKISDVLQWKGDLYLDLRNTDLALWKAYVDYPIAVAQGSGSVRAWLNLDHARVADFTADLTLSNVSARLRKDLAPLSLARVDGRIAARELLDPRKSGAAPTGVAPTFGARGHSLALSDFSLTTEDGLRLPPTSISESYVPASDKQPEKTTLKAKILDLETLANFAGRLPLSPAQRQMLADFAPRGQFKDFSAQWQGAYPDIASYQLQGQFAGLSLKAQPAHPAQPRRGKIAAQAAVPAIPGFENLSGRVDASDKGGRFALDSAQLTLAFPGYFADPLMPFDQLKMEANWSFQDQDQLLFQVERMNFVQQGMTGSLSGKHLMPLTHQPGKPLGEIDMTGKLSGFDVRKIDRYLPLQTPEHLRHWLNGALLEGIAQDVSLKLKGDLAQFPFRVEKAGAKPSGLFSVKGRIEQGKLNYAPGIFAKDGSSPLWPLAEQIKGSFAFENTRMEIRGESAQTHGAALSAVKAVIPDLLAADSVLEIDGNASALLQDYVRYVNDSPVTDWIANFTEETKAGGNAKLALKLRLPLNHMLDARVQGVLQLANNDVTLQDMIPPLSGASGKLEFNEKGLNLNGISANLLGGPVRIAGGTQSDGTIRIKGEGSASSEGLRRAYSSAAIQGVAQHIKGSTRYSATISVKKRQPELLIESNLHGLALDFPAPLRKSADDSLPLKVQMNALPSDDALILRDEIRIALGSSIGIRYLRRKTVEKQANWQVLRGGIGVNVPPPEPDSGLVANVNLETLSVDDWRRVVASMVSAAPEKAPAGGADGADIAQYIEPDVLAARATALYVMGKKLDNVVVGASHQKNVWQANIDSRQASGYLTWNAGAAGLGKVSARLATLTIPQAAASDVGELLEGKNATTQIPSLDIVAENFELFNKKLGRLEVVANNVQTPALREWRINKLSITNDDAVLKAAGNWAIKGGDNATSLTYALDLNDAGKLLQRFGFANVMRGGKGKMDGDVNWRGLPFALDIPSLSGQIHLDMESGQFLKVDPGAAKLLGVLSLQSLPRRLTLDFRDVFSEGFAFDGITGSALINKGVASTDNLKMRSVNATVLMDGSADIAKESQNLHVVVIPEINAGAASVAYALAVNPVIGLGTFLAQLFLREPLARAFTFEYQITGPWKDPAVTKLETKSGTAPAGAKPTPGKAIETGKK